MNRGSLLRGRGRSIHCDMSHMCKLNGRLCNLFLWETLDFVGIWQDYFRVHSERFAHFSAKSLIEIDLLGEKSHSKMYLRTGYC